MKFESGVGFSYGMRRVRAEVAAAVGAELLDRHHAGGDAARDRLLRALDRRRRGGALERLRRALPHHQDRHEQRQRQEQPNGGARQVDVEVAELLQPIAGEAANDRHRRRHAGRRRHELQERDDEHLREVGQARLAAVVLQVRVGGEARDRVERERRLHVADAVRIERQVLLQRHDRPGRQPHDDVRDEQRERVALPVLLIVRIDADQAQHQPLDRHEDRIEPRALAGEHPVHVAAEQRARGDREQDRECDGDVFSAHRSLRTSLGPQHRVHQVHERRDAQDQRQHGHGVTYTRSQSVTKPSIAANVASPRTTIANASITVHLVFVRRDPTDPHTSATRTTPSSGRIA